MSRLTSSCTAHYVPFSKPAGDRTVWLVACDKSYYYHGPIGNNYSAQTPRKRWFIHCLQAPPTPSDVTALRIKWGMALPYSVFIFSHQKSNNLKKKRSEVSHFP
eukprot:sb/3478115/